MGKKRVGKTKYAKNCADINAVKISPLKSLLILIPDGEAYAIAVAKGGSTHPLILRAFIDKRWHDVSALNIEDRKSLSMRIERMLGYIVVDVTIQCMEGFMEYAARIPELIAKHKGRYIVKGAEPKVVRLGEEVPQYSVIIEFPSVQAADDFIEERAQSELIEIFNRSTVGRILRVEGCA